MVNEPLTNCWKSLQKVSVGKEVKILDFSTFCSSPFPDKLFVRACYDELVTLIFEYHNKFLASNRCYAPIIYGTPGIGKSYFGYYLLLCLAKKKATVVYYDGRAEKAYLFSEAKVSSGHLDIYDQYLSDRNAYYIVDSAKARVVEAKTILITSPFKRHWKMLDKEKGIFFTMPIWSEKELLECREMYSDVDEVIVKENFSRWGGVPRYVLLFGTHPQKQESLREAIATSSPDMLTKFTGTEFAKDDICHRLVHIIPKLGYQQWSHDFASPFVASEVSKHLYEDLRTQLETFLVSSQGIAPLAALRGYLLESYTHRKLSAGGNFKIRNLETGGTSTLTLLPLEIVKFGKTAPTPVPGKYYLPDKSNFESVDSYVAPNLLFQMTVSNSHPIKNAGMQKILTVVASDWEETTKGQEHPKPPAAKLYFVVPSERYINFQKQPYVAMKSVGDASNPGKEIFGVIEGKNLKRIVRSVEQYALEVEMAS